MHTFQVGIFGNGMLIYQFGLSITCTHQQAEAVVLIMETLPLQLKDNHYIAYDYK